jgi:hypothetical protein
MKSLWAWHWLMHTAGLSVVPLRFGAAVVLALRDRLAARLFSFPVLRFFGKYSYGLYIIHALMTPLLDKWFSVEVWISHFQVLALFGALSLATPKIACAPPLHGYHGTAWRSRFAVSEPQAIFPILTWTTSGPCFRQLRDIVSGRAYLGD